MKTLVVGAGVSGRAAAALARSLGDDVTIYDRDPAAIGDLAAAYPTAAGEWSADLLDRVDRVVVSPGVPEHSLEVRDALAAGFPVISEVELAASVLDSTLVAVTGTNGKSTVTGLITDMLQADGRKAVAAGNIGTALSSVVVEPWDVVVVEVSSFQLRFIERFHPRVAVLLNIAPDHLDWHGGFEPYAAAKAKIFQNQNAEDALVYDIDDAEASSRVAVARSRLVPVSGHRVPEGGGGPVGDRLVLPAGEIGLGSISDPAYLVDLAAAGVAAGLLDVSLDAVERTVVGFSPGPHRRTLVGTWEGVAWVNDSKATNPHAALASIQAYPSVVLIAGGRNKGLDLTPMLSAANLRGIVAIGEAAAELSGSNTVMASDLGEAVELASELAKEGDTVLLAPGCASFDMFDSYMARGDAFEAAVAAKFPAAEVDGG